MHSTGHVGVVCPAQVQVQVAVRLQGREGVAVSAWEGAVARGKAGPRRNAALWGLGGKAGPRHFRGVGGRWGGGLEADPWSSGQGQVGFSRGGASRPGCWRVGAPKWLLSAELGHRTGLQAPARPMAMLIHPEPSLGASQVTMGTRGQLWAARKLHVLWERQVVRWVC